MAVEKRYNEMSVFEQENFLAHATADLVHRMYYENSRKGLEVMLKNLTAVTKRAQDCLSCLSMLEQGGDIHDKLCLLLEYMVKSGLSEEFVSNLIDFTEMAQDALAQSSGAMPTDEERRELLQRLHEVMDRNSSLEPCRKDTKPAEKPIEPVKPLKQAVNS